jgi:glycerol-3-phosphate dehydrogenase (NAD(P)+)
METLRRDGENREFLPGHPFPEQLQLHHRLEPVLDGVRDLLLVVPSHAFRAVLQTVRPLLPEGARVAWASKGFDEGSGLLLHEVAAQELPPDTPLAVASGPTFAGEVAAGLPTAITVAASEEGFGDDLRARLHGGSFRVYTHSDLLGLSLGGSVKNVLAIAAGISDGLGFGANARAALITRGLAEMMRLGEAMGARRETLMGLGGLGDLVLTCTDDQSRNRRLGLALGRDVAMEEAERAIGQVVEGVRTAREVRRRAMSVAVEMPICEQTYRVLYEGLDPREAVANLFAREPKAEC